MREMGNSASAAYFTPSSDSTHPSAFQASSIDSAHPMQRLTDGKPKDAAQPSTLQLQSHQEQLDSDNDCVIVTPKIVFVDLVADDEEDIPNEEEPVGAATNQEQEEEPKDISEAVPESRAREIVNSSAQETKEKTTLKRKSDNVMSLPPMTRVKTQEGEFPDKIFYAVSRREEGKQQKWSPCKLIESVIKDNKMIHRVKFLGNVANNAAATATVSGKEFALSTINPKLTIGTRVIAKFGSTNIKLSKRFVAGVVGEEASEANHNRYLVFSDYGLVQYASIEEVREVSEASENVWEDVHENLRQFIHDYLQSQTQTQGQTLLPVEKNQLIETERHGKWKLTAVVQEIDCSIVKMHFPDENVQEWLHRSSKRLGPIFKQSMQKTSQAIDMEAKVQPDV